jgi:hypothetical protein
LYGDLSSDQVMGYEVCDIFVALFPLLGTTHGPIHRTKMVGGEDIRCGVAVLLPPPAPPQRNVFGTGTVASRGHLLRGDSCARVIYSHSCSKNIVVHLQRTFTVY